MFENSACTALVLCGMNRMAWECSAGGRGFAPQLLPKFLWGLRGACSSSAAWVQLLLACPLLPTGISRTASSAES